jgi:hypothetical protein
MTDHHDFSFDDDHAFEHSPPPDDHLAWDDAGHDFDADGAHFESPDAAPHDFGPHDFGPHDPESPDPESPDPGPREPDSPGLDAAPDAGLPADSPPDVSDFSDVPDVFPPAVDVGDLPEPVDGFPWIDTGSLGLAGIAATLHDQEHTDAVRPEELAEYAGADLPPGADPWAALADSDDPATAALAKWWQRD